MADHSGRRQKISLQNKLYAYLMNHLQVLFASLGRLVRTPFTSLMTILVLAVTVSLAGSFYVLVKNVKQFSENLHTSNQISVFLKQSVSDKQGRQLARQIEQNSQITRVTVISKSQAMAEFKQYSGFGEALKALDKNPLPVVLEVLPETTLTDEGSLEKLMAELKRYPQVDFVQLDMLWIQRLQSILQLLERGVLLLNVLLGIAVIFITGNTIRLELQNRREEVLIAKLVGATHAFVQRPFVYTGFWLGFFSGCVAWVIITAIILFLQGPVEHLSQLYEGHFKILYLGFAETLALTGITTVLGILGAWVVLFYQLQQIKPR